MRHQGPRTTAWERQKKNFTIGASGDGPAYNTGHHRLEYCIPGFWRVAGVWMRVKNPREAIGAVRRR
jgi:hypothetical protein